MIKNLDFLKRYCNYLIEISEKYAIDSTYPKGLLKLMSSDEYLKITKICEEDWQRSLEFYSFGLQLELEKLKKSDIVNSFLIFSRKEKLKKIKSI